MSQFEWNAWRFRLQVSLEGLHYAPHLRQRVLCARNLALVQDTSTASTINSPDGPTHRRHH
jgi:hypothetical protein